MSETQTRATLEVQQRREAEWLLSACSYVPQTALTAQAAGVTAGMLPRLLRPFWREILRQCESGNADLDISATAWALQDATGEGEETSRAAARQFLTSTACLPGDWVHAEEHCRRLVETTARLALVSAHEAQVAAQAVVDDDAYLAATTRADVAKMQLLALRDKPVSWLDEVVGVVEAAMKPDTTPLMSTGLAMLDERLGGGWGWGWLVVVMAPAKAGKSALAINGFARAALKQGYCVRIVSLEMSRVENVQRFLAAESGVPTRAQRKGDLSLGQQGQLNNAGDVVASWRADVVCGLRTMDEIAAYARVEHGKGSLHMLVVDYLQLVDNGMDNRVLDLERTTRGCKLLANELGILVVLISQPTNADAKSGDVGLFSGKGTGAIAADCDVMLVPTRDPEEPSRAGLSMPGARHADAHTWPLGTLVFDGARMSFRQEDA